MSDKLILTPLILLLSFAGKGQINSNGASGASHAGRGGRGYSWEKAVLPYGDIFSESTWGSGGGSNTVNGNNGGRGGGYIHMYATQSIEISGVIKANGGSSSVNMTF